MAEWLCCELLVLITHLVVTLLEFISLTYLGSFLYCNLPFLVDDLDNLFLHAKETDCRKSDVFSVFHFRNLCRTQSKKTTLPMLHLEARSLRESIHASTQRTVGFDVYFFPGNNRVSLYVLIHAALCDDQIPGKFLCQEKKKNISLTRRTRIL